jgi:hypothetical protein
MTDTPKFTVVDRRKFRDAGEDASSSLVNDAKAPPAEVSKPAEAKLTDVKADAKTEAKAGPRLTLVEPPQQKTAAAVAEPPAPVDDAETEPEEEFADEFEEAKLPPAPTAEEASFQKAAYEKAAERIDDLVRAQNPGAPAPEKIGFEHLVQQLYLSALMQMGAGTPEGQRPRVDILGARQTIDLVSVLAEKTQGNLTPTEDQALQTVLYELRMTFLELTRMISAQPQGPLPPPPGGAKR